MVKKPRRGIRVDDGSSQKTSSSLDSSVTMDGVDALADDGGVDDGSSLAMDAMDDEEEEIQPEDGGGASSAGGVQSGIPPEDEF